MLDTTGILILGEAPLCNNALSRLGSRLIPFGKGWKARIRDGRLGRVEGSLKHYNDGRIPVIKAELTDSLAAVFADISAFATVNDWAFDRLDLARDVAEPTAPLVRACRQHRFPSIRKAAEVSDDDSSIRWGNRRTAVQVHLYDSAKKHRAARPSSRLEVRLGRKTISKLGLQREISWARLAEVFESYAAGLPDAAIDLSTGRLGTGQAIARMGNSFGRQVAQEAFQLLTQGRSRPTARKIKKEMNEGFALQCGKSPRQAFTLPRVSIGKNLSTVLPSGECLGEPSLPPAQANIAV